MRQEPIAHIRTIETKRFKVVVDAIPELTSVDEHFGSRYATEEVHEKIDSGEVVWFCARCRVIHKDSSARLATDYLSCCLYDSFEAFAEQHDGYIYYMVTSSCRAARRTINEMALGISLTTHEEEHTTMSNNKPNTPQQEVGGLDEDLHVVMAETYSLRALVKATAVIDRLADELGVDHTRFEDRVHELWMRMKEGRKLLKDAIAKERVHEIIDEIDDSTARAHDHAAEIGDDLDRAKRALDEAWKRIERVEGEADRCKDAADAAYEKTQGALNDLERM